VIIADSIYEWQHKGHVYGECMSKANMDLMYVHIPKNASSWTKPNLNDWGWEFFNYHTDKMNKHALVVLRDPIERWLSGIAEYLTLYHPTMQVPFYETEQLIFDRITFDDHTERQVKFIQGIDTDNCTFLWCDQNYRNNFSQFVTDYLGSNKYYNYAYQHVSEDSPSRKRFKHIFQTILNNNPKYLNRLQQHFADDYALIEQVNFYGTGRLNK
jgi:hypothetical protein